METIGRVGLGFEIRCLAVSGLGFRHLSIALIGFCKEGLSGISLS